MDNDDLKNRFTFHPSKNDQAERYQAIRQRHKMLALWLADQTDAGACCPPSRELSLAITHLEESVYWANASIARHE